MLLCPRAGEGKRHWSGRWRGWEDTDLVAGKGWTLLRQALCCGTSHTPTTKCHSRGLQVSLSHCTLRHKQPSSPQAHSLHQALPCFPEEVLLSGVTSGT